MRCTASGTPHNIFGYDGKHLFREIAGPPLDYTLSDQVRVAAHRWWASDLGAFRADYPDWQLTFGIREVLDDIHARNVEQWERPPRDRAQGARAV